MCRTCWRHLDVDVVLMHEEVLERHAEDIGVDLDFASEVSKAGTSDHVADLWRQSLTFLTHS